MSDKELVSANPGSSNGERKRLNDTTTLKKGLHFDRYFTSEQTSPYDEIEWEIRTAAITAETGATVFEQENVEVPKSWSQLATNIVASKYFHGRMNASDRENSVRQLIGRVTNTITAWGLQGDYFRSEQDAIIFSDELSHLLLNQKAAFNSPVWFNCGVEAEPQCSACFINSVQDSMHSILGLARTEGMLFKWGSGTGSNLSPLRSSREQLSGGGIASGPVSFMKGFDAFAGVIKSGGKTRRAAKMVILNIDHPDIVEFIECKAKEEKKAWKLIEFGYDGAIDGEVYGNLFFQNANNSVRITDDFMKSVQEDGNWSTRAVTTGQEIETFRARDLMKQIAEAAHACGDPGLQFDTTINRWHTCKNTDAIHASNPCSEYMFLDDSACNLASLNLMKFLDADGRFDVEAFRHAVGVIFVAQEIIVGNASYPTEKIRSNSNRFRPLGLGYANLGALLMFNGLPYDSDAGRDFAAAITALMTGEAYVMSAKLAAEIGPFAGFDANREPMIDVIAMHRDSVKRIDAGNVPSDLYQGARQVWDQALELGRLHGFRNAQATVLAPTGTIGFMMDCDTTGIEPDLALVKYKKLVGGGTVKIVNGTVPAALKRLGYSASQVQEIVEYVDSRATIQGAPFLKNEHLPVFDCAFKPLNGNRNISYMGHLKMMAATQPFISGAISKTVNVPQETTTAEILDLYGEAWRMGLKAVAIYRDGCKRTQPLNSEASSPTTAHQEFKPVRRKLADERRALTKKFSIGGHEGYLTVGMYDDGLPGEIFVRMAKEGSTIAGLMDAFAISISMALQYGVPLEVLTDKFSHSRFEPSGYTGDPDIPYAKSIMDYIFRWLDLKFLSGRTQSNGGEAAMSGENATPELQDGAHSEMVFQTQLDAPFCAECGSIMVRNGACYKCMNCGSTSGCS